MSFRLRVVFWVIALLVLGWLFKQSTQVDIDLHVRIVRNFELLQEEDAKLSKYVLQSRYGLLKNYDPLVVTQDQIENILGQLEHEAPLFFSDGKTSMQKTYSEYRALIQQKNELVENFKSHNAVLRNSLSYFPIAVNVQLAHVRKGSREEDLLHELLENVLSYDQNVTELLRNKINANLSELSKSSIGKDPAIANLFRHVEVIVSHKVEVDELTRDITQSGTVAVAEKLLTFYNEDFARRDHSAANYRLLMAVLAALMLTYVGWLMLNLQQARNTLTDSLRELKFQKDALDQHSIVSVTDRYGKIIYTNDKFSEISQYSRDELLGQDHRMLNSGHHPKEFFKEMWATISSGGIWQGEIRNRRKDGSFYWVASTIAPFMDDQGNPIRYVSIRTDITERKASETAIMKAKEDAEVAREAAEKASKIKSDFLANMSHEIRTPMNGIIGMTALALDTELTPEQRKFISMIKTSADALLGVINDILDFSKIESGMMTVEKIEFSIGYMLSDTIKPLAIRAGEKNIELLVHVAPDVPDRIYGDPGRLRQVIINLVGNAIKFTESGEIVVSVTKKPADLDGQVRLRFSVRDTGIGIPKDKFQSIFESFSQADTSTTRKYGGTGLGLTISSQLVELMGGHMGLESQVGQGSHFYFDLDMPVGSFNSFRQYLQTGPISGKSVLVVDDNATNRMLLEEILLGWGMKPKVVESGPEALLELQRAAAEGKPYDLALLDKLMPGMDGLELAGVIRQHPEYTPAAVMMLTSAGQRGDADLCREVGVKSYLMKPVSESDLLDAIMMALGERVDVDKGLITRHTLRESRRKLNLLLAEDNEVNQILTIRVLEKLGHQVTLALNGREALEKWSAGGYDAILMDVDMPEMNGLEATQKIRAAEKSSGGHTPIIAMTAHAMEEARGECLSHGMDGYLSKPINIEALWHELDLFTQPESGQAQEFVGDKKFDLVVADFGKARQTMDNNEELFKIIVAQYLRDSQIQLQAIQDGLDSKDVQKIKRSAHGLQGMVGVFAAEKALHAAREVEVNADQPNCQEFVDALRDAMDELKSAIESFKW